MVYIELKRRGESVFYFRHNFECDFLVRKKNRVGSAIQVTQKLDETNQKREIGGLLEAMKEHGLDNGIILTEEESGERTIEGKKITIMPVWEWLLRG
jgi:predicted AAA+ superfamily ATPase